MDIKLLESIISRLKVEDTRWDAILQLKTLNGKEWVPHLIQWLSSDEWIIRWCIVEKLGELKDLRAVKSMMRLLGDRDEHVRRNTIKAFVYFGDIVVPELVRYFSHPHVMIRNSVQEILLKMGKRIIPTLEKCLYNDNWVDSNRILDILYRFGGEEAEATLIRSLDYNDVMQNAIMILGRMQSYKATPALIKKFKNIKVRRMLLYTLFRINNPSAYPFIVKVSASKHGSLVPLAKRIVHKIGEPMLIPILKVMLKCETANIEVCIELLEDIGPEKVMKQICKLSDRSERIRVATSQLRKKYGFT